jgi:SAM-dependent methyltransferase
MLTSALSRLLWRVRRWKEKGGGTPAQGIERYSVFQGQLHIRGALEVPGGVARLALHMPAGEVLPLRFTAADAGRIAFDQIVAVPGSPAEAAASVLVASLEDGGTVRVESLGEAVGDPAHALSARFLAMLAERGPGVMLEVGSRARSGVIRRHWAPAAWEYSGFDIVAGPNVDVVGDAHAISRHYPLARFDAVMAFSVLEHLLMPWKFVIELNRVLKPGAIGLFTSHQCWPMHDQPWDFWRFSDAAWTGLLNAATGFEIIAADMGEPAYVVANRCSIATAFAEQPAGALASFVLFRKTGETRLEWPVELGEILGTRYPGAEG